MRSPVLLASLAVVAVAVAGPAGAVPGMSADYQVTADGSQFGVWTVTSGCETLEEGCTAQVQAREAGWTAQATLIDGQWVLIRRSEELFDCRDGGVTPGELRAKWDPWTLGGSLLLVPDGKRCGQSSAPLRSALRLVRL